MLDLSGPKLRRAFESLAECAEPTGGVERYVGALALKASLFEEVLGKGRVHELTEAELCDLCAFIAPVRRRIAPWLGENGFAAMRQRLVALLDGWSDVDDRRPPHERLRRRASRPTASTAGCATSRPRCCITQRRSAIR